MNTSVDQLQLEAAALNLPQHLRARLAELLISSLDKDSAIEQAWLTEATRRAEELSSGKVSGIPASVVFENAYKRFG